MAGTKFSQITASPGNPLSTEFVLGVGVNGTTDYLYTLAQIAGSVGISITAGKIFSCSGTLTLSGTDGSTLNIGAGGTLGTNAFTSTAYAPAASPTFTGTVTAATISHSKAEVDASYGYFTPSSGGTVTMTAGMGRAIINPSATLTSLTITVPPTPVDGQIARGATSQAVTVVTMNTSDGATIVAGLSSLAVDGTFAFLYRSATTSWYPSN